MTALVRYSFSTIFTLAFSLLAPSSMAQQYKVGSPDAAALAMELRSGDTYRIMQALDQFPYYEDVYEDNSVLVDIDPLVVDGLISALDSQLDLYLSGDIEIDEEYAFESLITPLATFFTRIADRDAIPVLLRATEVSGVSTIALAEFGPDIVPVIIDYIESPERTVYQIMHVFNSFAKIVHFWRPLDAETHAMLRQHAIKYIQGYVPEHLANDPQAHTLKSDGAYLASVLGDVDLKPMVESLADEFPGFTKLYLEQWYDPNQDAADRNQIAPND